MFSDDENPTVPALQNSNELPSKSEVNMVEAGILQAETKLSQIDEQMKQLVAPPCRRLPSELLAEIFQIATPPEGLEVFGGIHRPPWTCTHVCQEWRRLALSTRTLWSKVRIHYGPWQWRLEHRGAWVSEILQRSHPAGLDLTLYLPNQFSEERQLYLEPLYLALALSASRWQRLDLGCLTIDLPNIFRNANIDRLQDFTFIERNHLDTVLPNEPLSAFSDASHLTSVNLRFEDASLLRLLQLPYHQLHQLSVEGACVPQLSTILPLCPNLTNLVIGSGPDIDLRLPHGSYPTLRALEFRNHPHFPMCSVLNLSELDSLQCHFLYPHEIDLLRMANIHWINLTSLQLRIFNDASVDPSVAPRLRSILSACVHLVELSLDFQVTWMQWRNPNNDRALCQLYTSFLTILPEDTTHVLPAMRSLDFKLRVHDPDPVIFLDELFLSMAESRSIGSPKFSQLAKLDLVFTTTNPSSPRSELFSLDNRNIQCWKSLRASGMHVSIHCKHGLFGLYDLIQRAELGQSW